MSQSSTMPPPTVLCFAASDPTGGAGIQADLMAVSALGCHALSVVTALTVQDTVGVRSVHPVAPALVEAQARVLLDDVAADVIKIGLLGSIGVIGVIRSILSDYPDVPVVFDPVLASGRGDPFADGEMIGALREWLLPQTTVLTPNSLEARRLAIDDAAGGAVPDLAACARRLIELGCRNVLLTGTHEEHTPEVINALYDASGLLQSDRWERLPGSYHGSGCTLASALAACLARRMPLCQAVRAAQDYTWRTLAAGFRAGRGQFIPDRFWAMPPIDERNRE